MKSDTPPPDIPRGDIQEHLEGLRRYLRGCRAMLAVEKCCSADLITPDDAETHLQAVQRWVEERENRTRADEWSDMAISLQEKYAEIATLREENDRLRTENVSLSNQRELAVAETREHKATIARLREEVEGEEAFWAPLIRAKDAEIDTYRGALEGVRREIDLFIQEEASQAGRVAGSVIRKRLMPYLSPNKPKGGMEQREADYYAGAEAGIDAAQILIPPEEHEALKRERNTYRGALEYCERHILDTCNESQTLIVIRKALKEGDPGEVPAPSEPSEKPCGTCGDRKEIAKPDSVWEEVAGTPTFMKPCPVCTPGKEGGEG